MVVPALTTVPELYRLHSGAAAMSGRRFDTPVIATVEVGAAGCPVPQVIPSAPAAAGAVVQPADRPRMTASTRLAPARPEPVLFHSSGPPIAAAVPKATSPLIEVRAGNACPARASW